MHTHLYAHTTLIYVYLHRQLYDIYTRTYTILRWLTISTDTHIIKNSHLLQYENIMLKFHSYLHFDATFTFTTHRQISTQVIRVLTCKKKKKCSKLKCNATTQNVEKKSSLIIRHYGHFLTVNDLERSSKTWLTASTIKETCIGLILCHEVNC